MSLRPKRGIARLKNHPHGGVNYTEMNALGINPGNVLDFSVCTNPFMPPPDIKEMLSTFPIDQYPDSEATELRQALSARLKVSTENILVASGTTELIRLFALAYFRQRDTILILEPTYGEYEMACQIAGTKLIRHRAEEKDNFKPKIEEVIRLIRKYLPRAVFVCNPNNPTGNYLSRSEIENILDVSGDSLLILDEAYVTFVKRAWNSTSLITRGNAVILRSMTKDFGITGLRLGYAIAPLEVIDSLRRVCPPWNVNIIAQKVGEAVLKEESYLKQSLLQVQEVKRFLTSELSRLGLTVLPSEANYFLVKVGNARKLRSTLLGHGILVRDCTSFGLPEYVRISPRTMLDCERLIEAVRTTLQKEKIYT
ncbi:MAG: aspartate aminotransferase [Chloroflexi bacterium RBG_16_50_9]|nr:MAG: aspartate aminotransferase [Chloroflexi bacterium RBG_16_50_9]